MTAAWLTRIQLNSLCRQVQRDMADAGELHRTLMRIVPDGLGDRARQQAGLLYRLDETEHGHTVLVQTVQPPRPQGLPANYGRHEVKDLAAMFDALRPGMNVRYRTTVNAAKRERLSLEKGKRGSIVPLNGREADEWWIRRAAEAGLEVHTLLPTPVAPARRRGGNPMRHSLVRFDGTAVVTDAKSLGDAVLFGIGRGKSYGAGLVSLAPAGSA